MVEFERRDNMKREYCECDNSSSTSTETDDMGQWDVCCDCNKPIEDTYQYLNHYDGQDHVFYEY